MNDNSPGDRTITAGAALEQYVLVTSAGTVTTGATDTPVGVTQNSPASGAPASIRPFGLTFIQAAAAISAWDRIMPAASGEVQTYDGADGSVFCGQALAAATAQGDLVPCVFSTAFDASDSVTSSSVAAANTAGALREFTTLTVSAEDANVITITLGQNVAAADLWLVDVYDAAMGTLAATAAWATAETGAGALSLSHATLESHLLTLSAGGAATLTVTDVGGGSNQSVYLHLRPVEAAAGGVAGCSYLLTLTYD